MCVANFLCERPVLNDVQYANKRVFYLTPQTLVNDLDKGRIDALDIVLLVIGLSTSLYGGLH
jgi:ERCC4-related helicase